MFDKHISSTQDGRSTPSNTNFEGHVMLNEDEYQKSVWKNLHIVLEYHNSPLVYWLHAYWQRR